MAKQPSNTNFPTSKNLQQTAKEMAKIEKQLASMMKGIAKYEKSIQATNKVWQMQEKQIKSINSLLSQQNRAARTVSNSFSGVNGNLLRAAASLGLVATAINVLGDAIKNRINVSVLGGVGIGRNASTEKTLDVLSKVLASNQFLQFKITGQQTKAIDSLVSTLKALPADIISDNLTGFISGLTQKDIPAFLADLSVDQQKALDKWANLQNVGFASQLKNAFALVEAGDNGTVDPLTKAALDASKSIEKLKDDFIKLSATVANELQPNIKKLADFIGSLSSTETMLGAGALVGAGVLGSAAIGSAAKLLPKAIGLGARGMYGTASGLAGASGAAARGIGGAYTGLGLGTGAGGLATGFSNGMMLAAPIIIGGQLYDDALQETSKQFEQSTNNPHIKRLLEQADRLQNEGRFVAAKRNRLTAQLQGIEPASKARFAGLFGTEALTGDFTPSQQKQIAKLRDQIKQLDGMTDSQIDVVTANEKTSKSLFTFTSLLDKSQKALDALEEKAKNFKAPANAPGSNTRIAALQDASIQRTNLTQSLELQQAATELDRIRKQIVETLPMGSIFSLPQLQALNKSLDAETSILEQLLTIAKTDSSHAGMMEQANLQAKILGNELQKRQNNRFLIDALKDAAIGEVIYSGAFEKIISTSDKNVRQALSMGIFSQNPWTPLIHGNVNPNVTPQQPRTALELLQQSYDSTIFNNSSKVKSAVPSTNDPTRLLKTAADCLIKLSNVLGVRFEQIDELAERENKAVQRKRLPTMSAMHMG